MLEDNAECRGSVLRLPILVLQCSKGNQLERGTQGRGLKFGFLRG